MLASLSRVNRRAGLDVQTRIAEVSQAANMRDSRVLLLLKAPAAADDSCVADAHRPAVDDVFGQACCRRCFRRGLPSFTAADAGEPAALGADEPAVPSDDRRQQSRPQQQRSSSRPAVLQPQ